MGNELTANNNYWVIHCNWGSEDVGAWWHKNQDHAMQKYDPESHSYATETDTAGWELVLQIMAQEEMYDSEKPVKHSKWSIR